MKVLENHIRKNNFDYYLIKRCETAAIYKQIDEEFPETIIAFEVFKIKNRPESKIFGKIIEAGESFPSNEDFGKTAWTYSTFGERYLDKSLSDANKRYEDIINGFLEKEEEFEKIED